MDTLKFAEKDLRNKARCCASQSNFAGKCCVRSVSWTIFILMYIVPTIVQSWSLAYFYADFNMVKILLVSWSCLIMSATIYAGIRLVIDCRHGKYIKDNNGHTKLYNSEDCTCEYAYCTPLWKPKSLLMGTHWMHLLYPWELCNIVSVGYFGKQLIDTENNWIIAFAFVPFIVFTIACGIGLAISCWIDDYRKHKIEQKKLENSA